MDKPVTQQPARSRISRVESFPGSTSTEAPRFTAFRWIQEPFPPLPADIGPVAPAARSR